MLFVFNYCPPIEKKGSSLSLNLINIKKHRYFNGPIILFITLTLLILFSMTLGRQEIGFRRLGTIFLSVLGVNGFEPEEPYQSIIFLARLPRILLAVLIGGGLAASGAAFQTIFRNPLVSPDILGVSAGAGFGAALGLIYRLSWWWVELLALGFGLLAVLLTLILARMAARTDITATLLSGIAIAALFSALIGVLKTLADPWNVLPSIVFWLLGSLGRSAPADVLTVLSATLLGLGLMGLYRYRIEALSAGDDEAKTMGIEANKVRLIAVGAATLITAVGVSVCGIVGWIGLIAPHLARIGGGYSFNLLLIRSFAIGAILTLAADDLIRTVEAAELPLGVMTSLAGAPIFIILLPRLRGSWR
ncbi:MAG: iron ABC transporter permease [Deltaproteobacteria bacterium]|nr:iron ABC transporter permease [Deltaproteobacteria bacterium]